METKEFSPVFNWLITPLLKCRFSRFKKYFLFFSPSLCHQHLALKIVPIVPYSIILSNFVFLSSCSIQASHFSCSPMLLDSIKFCKKFILLSSSFSFLFDFAFLSVAYFNNCSWTFHFIFSFHNAGSTSLPFSYLSRTSWIAVQIWLT